MRPIILLLAAFAPAVASAQISRTELVRAPLDGIARGDGAIMRVELPPRGTTDRHRHPGQEYVYVVSGRIVIEPDGGPPVTLEAGQARVNPANEIHRVRNPSRRRAARVVVVALIPEGSRAVIRRNDASQARRTPEASRINALAGTGRRARRFFRRAGATGMQWRG